MIRFEHNGTDILNPFLSDCGRYAVSPTHYGFEPAETGGACKALIKKLPNGDAIWLTDESGIAIPKDSNEAVFIGYFDSNGEQLAFHKVPDEEEIAAIQNRRYLCWWGSDFAEPGTKVVDRSFFSTEAGYSVADQVAISQLNEGEIWHSSDYQSHTVTLQRPYNAQFTDYDDVLPVFSPFLVDTSWHMDACPQFTWENPLDPDLSNCRIVLWIGYQAEAKRAAVFAGNKRFNLVVNLREPDNTMSGVVSGLAVLSTETIEELREQCNRWFEDNVGYRPDTEEEDIPIGKLVMRVGQMAFLHARNSADKHEESAASDQETVYPKCIVLCSNSNGEQEFHTCAPEVTKEQYDNGEHYDLAKQNAEDNGYEGPMIAFDASDPAARQLGSILTWL